MYECEVGKEDEGGSFGMLPSRERLIGQRASIGYKMTRAGIKGSMQISFFFRKVILF